MGRTESMILRNRQLFAGLERTGEPGPTRSSGRLLIGRLALKLFRARGAVGTHGNGLALHCYLSRWLAMLILYCSLDARIQLSGKK